ncbi:hypothetical protein DSO57_1012182 [Entomophthora muscae]|uniref:Uncharacterized protein n=1 Tax=Entomophthora muscae TaxID=34485 RepID=A0ACC2TGX5_9FUNG|nr:hypothetical protein DSO57_1012182 [Entomophthora muscae]
MNSIILLLTAVLALESEYDLTILHTNDVHSRYDQITKKGKDCTDAQKHNGECYGGLARIKTKVDEIRAKNKNTLLLDAGDQFQGNFFYYFSKGNATLQAMNHLQYNISTLGNHEFDNGPLNTQRIIKDYRFPVVSCNLDIPEAYKDLKEKVKPYHLFPEYNLGVIGYIFENVMNESNLKGIASKDPIAAVQSQVDILQEKGIKRIIAVSHNGYEEDKTLAEKVKGLALIVGGHTHSYLGPEAINFRGKKSKGPYPTKVTNLDGNITYIVQAHEWTYYLGHIDIKFGEDGYIAKINGQPIMLNSTVPQDPNTVELVKEMRAKPDEYMFAAIGRVSKGFTSELCKVGECATGSLYADVMLNKYPEADFAMLNSGAIREVLGAGDISNGQIYSSIPYDNAVVVIEQTGHQIREVLNRSINYFFENNWNFALQVSGIRFTYKNEANGTHTLGKVVVLGKDKQYHPLNLSQTYQIVTLGFLADGGSELIQPKVQSNPKDSSLEDLVIAYIKSHGLILPPSKNRAFKVDDIDDPMPALVTHFGGCRKHNII